MKYAVLIKKTVTIPGDERSRTNPGHGYEEHVLENTEFKEFATQDDLKRWLESNNKSHRVIEFQELKIERKVTIDLKRPTATRVS